MEKYVCKIPVALFIFKRKDTVLRIIERIAEVKPPKVYLLGDEGRNDSERQMVSECREAIEKAIDWDCETIRNYASENRGVYQNIGCGAKWVFEREERCIFIEDDNLPEVSFFRFCEELLEKYESNDDVLWICGTDYLAQYSSPTGDSYMFTKHLLPCGWASWSKKFLKYYDGEFENLQKDGGVQKLKKSYKGSKLFDQQYYCMRKEMFLKKVRGRYASWDYQMAFSVRFFGKYGISPCKNQIKNIGADSFSEHGGTSLAKTMTRRFCDVPSYPMEFPLKHPENVQIDPIYEKKIEKIIRLPFGLRMKNKAKRLFMRILGKEDVMPFSMLRKRK